MTYEAKDDQIQVDRCTRGTFRAWCPANPHTRTYGRTRREAETLLRRLMEVGARPSETHDIERGNEATAHIDKQLA